MPVVGYVSNGSREAFAPCVAAFVGGLADTGHVEGQNVKDELVVNLKAAKVLGMTVPQSLTGRADEVIE